MTRVMLCASCGESFMAENNTDGMTGRMMSPQIAPASDTVGFELPPDRPSEVTLTDPIAVKELAMMLHVKPYQLIKALILRKIFVTVDKAIDFTTAALICSDFGVTARLAS